MDSTQVIPPILMQRQCDGGKGDMSPEQWAKVIAARLIEGAPVHGCGTWFQWWWGSGCVCPTCGRTWSVIREDMKRYRVQDRISPAYDREMEERIMRNVLARLGR